MKSRIARWFPFIALGLAVLCLFAVQSQAGDNLWTTTGPYGLRILDLAIDPNDSQVIYAASPDGTVNVYKSVDGGITWLPSSDGIPEEAWAAEFAFDPDDSSIVYVATESGLYKSTDAGASWELKGTVEIGGVTKIIHTWSMAISPVDGTLFIGSLDNGFGAPGGIYRSRDGGETWEHLGNGAPTSTVTAITIAPSASHIIYAGTYYSSQGAFKSTDGGDSWQTINNGFGVYPDIWRFTVDPYDSQVVYMGTTTSGIYKSTDGGQSWLPIGMGLDSTDIRAIVIDPQNQQVIYAGAGSNPGTGIPGVYRSLDNSGTSWAPMNDGMGPLGIWSLAIDLNTPQNIYAGTNSGVWKYTLVSGPDDYTVTINDGALYTNQTAVTLTLTAPAGTTEMILSNDGGFAGAIWESFAAQKPWTITAYGSYVLPRVVYAKFKTYGTVSGLYQDDIILDVTAPTGSVEVSGTVASVLSTRLSPLVTVLLEPTDTTTYTVYLPLLANNARPGLSPVTLRLSATDDVSGVDRMRISNDPGFPDAHWEAYATEKRWWIPDTGTTTVYVKFRDRAGNESIVYSDTVTP